MAQILMFDARKVMTTSNGTTIYSDGHIENGTRTDILNSLARDMKSPAFEDRIQAYGVLAWMQGNGY